MKALIHLPICILGPYWGLEPTSSNANATGYICESVDENPGALTRAVPVADCVSKEACIWMCMDTSRDDRYYGGKPCSGMNADRECCEYNCGGDRCRNYKGKCCMSFNPFTQLTEVIISQIIKEEFKFFRFDPNDRHQWWKKMLVEKALSFGYAMAASPITQALHASIVKESPGCVSQLCGCAGCGNEKITQNAFPLICKGHLVLE